MKKRSVLFILLFLLVVTSVEAAINSIHEYLQRVDDDHYLVLGLNGKGGDSLAAIDVALGIKRHNVFGLDIETVMENEIIPSSSKILIGHPCDNSLVQISCNNWQYTKGEALIQVKGNDLIVAGTTVDDTRRAAKVLANYPSYSILKSELAIVVTGTGTRPLKQNIVRAKSQEELICGDLICEPGESNTCYIDCAGLTCYDICLQEGFGEAACRDKKSNPTVPSCLSAEADRGAGFCASEKVCCCEKKEAKATLKTKQGSQPKELGKTVTYFRKENIGELSAVAILIIAIITVVLVLMKGKKK